MKNQSKRTLLLILLCIICKTQPSGSDNCLEYDYNLSVCTKCPPGYHLELFFCSPCNPMCVCSSDSNTCEDCLNITIGGLQFKSYQLRQNDRCVLCNQTIQSCLQCQYSTILTKTGLHCTKCMNGTYPLIDGNCSKQLKCTTNCQICINRTHCQLCKQSFYIDDISIGSCSNISCTQYCNICNNSITCSLCINGFYINNNIGTCQPCLQNCQICKDNKTCQTCIPAFIFNGSQCINTTLLNCIKYAGDIDNSICLLCELGYYNLNGVCQQCSGCSICTQQFICQSQCNIGFINVLFACRLNQQRLYLFLFFIWLFGGSFIMFCQ